MIARIQLKLPIHGGGDVSLKTKRAYRCRQRQRFTKDDNDTEEKLLSLIVNLRKVFNNNAIGKSIYVNGEGFKVVGISEDSGMDAGGMGMPEESTVQLPTKTFNKYMGNLSQGMPQLLVTVDKSSAKKMSVKS